VHQRSCISYIYRICKSYCS